MAELAIRESVDRRRLLYPDLAEGYVCAYSEILLEGNEDKQGDYASFDHAVPNRGDRAHLCSRIANDLKGWMTDLEFRHFLAEVMDPEAPRRVHRLLDEQTSGEFLRALRTVARAEGSPKELRVVRTLLKDLSARFRY